TIGGDGTGKGVEDIRLDFSDLQRHGIFRDIPMRYRYDDRHDRLIAIDSVSVLQNSSRGQWEKQKSGSNLRLKIGDASRTVSGAQRYTISYRVSGALNPFEDHDELFLNVTCNGWSVPIEEASAAVAGPA